MVLTMRPGTELAECDPRAPSSEILSYRFSKERSLAHFNDILLFHA